MTEADNIVGLYNRKGAAWNDLRRGAPFIERAWVDRFADRVTPGGAVLDVGCGSGEPIAEHLIARGFDVTGVDTSAPMLKRARARRPGSTWIEADMRTLDLKQRFDGVVMWDSFFHLAPDAQRAMFPRIADHANANAPLLFTSGPHAGEAIGDLFGEPLYHASLAPDDYRALFAANDLEEIAHVAEDQSAGGRTVWLCQFHA